MIKLALRKSATNWVDMGDGVSFLIDYPTSTQEQKLQELIFGGTNENLRNIKLAQWFIKYTVKDWKGIDEPCKLVNNELESELWWALVKDPEQCIAIYLKIENELGFYDVDKKKSNTSDGSISKAD